MTEELEKLLENVPARTEAQFFGGGRWVGFDVGISRPGWGWGHITIAYDTEEKTWHLDDEDTSKEHVIEFLREAIPNMVEQLYGKGDVKLEYPEEEYIALTIEAKEEK